MERTREPSRSRPDRRDDRASGQPATLTVAAVPIGRPEEACRRRAAALSEAPIGAAEDTRRLRRLASALGVRPTGRVVSYYDAVEAARTPQLLAELGAGGGVRLGD